MIRKLSVTLLGAALLGVAAFADARAHAIATIVTWGLTRAVDPPISKSAGRARRWIGVALVLGLLGALLGPKDGALFAHPVSYQGALAATTMVARGLGITFFTSGLVGLVPRDRLLARLAGTPFAHLGEGIAVAVGLVPDLSRELRARSAASKRPAIGRLSPAELHRTAIAIVGLTRTMAQEAAVTLAQRRTTARGSNSNDGNKA